MENVGYYIFVLVAIIVAFLVIKKVASCLIKSAILIAMVSSCCYLLSVFAIATSSGKIRLKASRSF